MEDHGAQTGGIWVPTQDTWNCVHYTFAYKFVNVITTFDAGEKPVAASWGAWGAFAHTVRGSAPHLPPPPVRRKAIFGKFLGFLPPQNRILPPQCPPTKKFLVPPLWKTCVITIYKSQLLWSHAKPEFRQFESNTGKMNGKHPGCISHHVHHMTCMYSEINVCAQASNIFCVKAYTWASMDFLLRSSCCFTKQSYAVQR